MVTFEIAFHCTLSLLTFANKNGVCGRDFIVWFLFGTDTNVQL